MALFGIENPAGQPAAAASGNTASDLIKDGSSETFAADVLDASMEVPVLVDFWAPWCGPCKQLGPILEKVVKSAKGQVRMVKIDIDKYPEIAQQLQVKSVPTVFAFHQGRPVTGFAGAKPESQVVQLVEQLIGGPIGPGETEQLMELAQASESAEEAAALYSQVLQQEPDNADAYGGLIRSLIAMGEMESAEEMLANVPEAMQANAAIKGAQAALNLAKSKGSADDALALSARLVTHPDDHQARFDLAVMMFARGEEQAAMGELCEIIRRDRGWEEDKARLKLVEFFDALGPANPLTAKGRRMLSSVLFA